MYANDSKASQARWMMSMGGKHERQPDVRIIGRGPETGIKLFPDRVDQTFAIAADKRKLYAMVLRFGRPLGERTL